MTARGGCISAEPGNFESNSITPELATFVAAAAAAVDAPLAGFSFINDGRLAMVSTFGWRGGTFAAAGTLCERVIANSEPLHEPSLLTENRWRNDPRAREIGARSYLGVPVCRNSKVVGSLFVMDTKARVFSRQDTETLERIGARLAQPHPLEHRRRIQSSSIFNSPEFLSNTLRLAKLGVWAVEPENRRVFWSDEVKRIHEVEPDFNPSFDEAVGFYPGEANHTIRNLVDRALRFGESYEAELPFVTARGRRIWVHTIGSPAMQDGRCVQLRGIIQEVTSRRENEDRYRLLAEWTDDLVSLTDHSGHAIYLSPSVHRKLGWATEDFAHIDWSDRVHPDDVEAIVKAQSLASSGRIANTRYRARRKDQSHIWLDLRGCPVLDETGRVGHIVWTSRDISAQVQLELWQRERIVVLEMISGIASLEQILNRLALAIESLRPETRATILLAELGETGTVLRDAAGPSMPDEFRRHIDGMPTGPTIGACGAAVHFRRRIISADIWTDPNWAIVEEQTKRFNLRSCWSEPFFASDGSVLGTTAIYGSRPGEPDEFELELISEAAKLCAIAIERRRADEVVRQSLADLASARDSLEAHGTELMRRNTELASASAESERLRRQAELDAISAEELRKRADAANRAKSDFLANMSHEIRTPMTAILGFADLLADRQKNGPDSGAPTDFVQAIRRNAEHLLSVINDILDISKIEAGRLSVERIMCAPATIVHDVATLLVGRAAEKGISLECNFDKQLPGNVITDPTRLRQIAINLLSNAIKFTNKGRVRVRLSYESPGPNDPTGFLVLQVDDTGIGIEPEHLSHLFTSFAQADASTTRKFGGSGLGLAISRRLARMLGGDITATSIPGKGSCFTLRMACRVATPGVFSPGPAGIENESTPLLNSYILLAEDGPDNQRLIVHLLRHAGARVEAVTNGVQAAEHCLEQQRLGHPFDLVLMDMQMPIQDGYESTRMLRAAGYTLPIVALTANVLTEQRRAAIECGCNDVIEKPIDRLRFLSICSKWAQRGASVSAQSDASHSVQNSGQDPGLNPDN